VPLRILSTNTAATTEPVWKLRPEGHETPCIHKFTNPYLAGSRRFTSGPTIVSPTFQDEENGCH
jgi:hypothetical protein